MRYDPLKTWFTADLHLGHANIIRFCDRPFDSVDAMDSALIANWNARVGHDHDVFVVGDFANRCHPAKLLGYFRAMHGRLHLAPGNHDKKPTLTLPWSSPPEKIREIDVGGDRVVLCHYAMRTWPGIGRGAIHLFGHSHGKLPPSGNSIDVGVDVFGFKPVRLDEIRDRLQAWPPGEVRPLDSDHHVPREERP